jgi:hypothetical protein
MVIIPYTPASVEQAVGSSSATIGLSMDDYYGVLYANQGVALYMFVTNIAAWIAQGIAATVFTVSDVSFIFTATAHQLQNGMPVQASNSGGALPTGVSSATTYWVNVIDVNNFYLYDTRAHALVGGATGQVQPSSNGSGTNSVTTVAVAGAGSMFVPANTPIIIDGANGPALAVIDDGTTGKCSLTPVQRF